jgi:hypothetical protein
MKAYRVAWLVLCVLLVIIGVSVAFFLSPAALACIFLVLSAAGSIATVCLVRDDRGSSRRNRTRLVVNSAVVTGATGGAFVGFAVLLGAGAFLLVALVVASSPYAVGSYSRWLKSGPHPSAAQVDALARALAYASPEYIPVAWAPEPGELEQLTDEQLCQQWRASYMALQQRTSMAKTIETVAERQRYLDEFERRNARGFAAWLTSGARAPGNPLPYLIGSRLEHPTINWDELTRGQDW